MDLRQPLGLLKLPLGQLSCLQAILSYIIIRCFWGRRLTDSCNSANLLHILTSTLSPILLAPPVDLPVLPAVKIIRVCDRRKELHE